MKLNLHIKSLFEPWLNKRGIEQGNIPVELARITERFSSDIKLPVTKNMVGRLLAPRFYKKISYSKRKTYYLLNKGL